jgi:hypothetical protein
MKRYNLKKLNDVGVKEQYQVKISYRLAALGSMDENVDMCRDWESIK